LAFSAYKKVTKEKKMKVFVLTQEATDSHDFFVQGVFKNTISVINRIVDICNGYTEDEENKVTFESVKKDMVDNIYEDGYDVFRVIEKELE